MRLKVHGVVGMSIVVKIVMVMDYQIAEIIVQIAIIQIRITVIGGIGFANRVTIVPCMITLTNLMVIVMG